MLLPLRFVTPGHAPEASDSRDIQNGGRVEKGSETEPAFSPAPPVYCYADVENRTITLASDRSMMPLEVFGILIRGFDNVDDPAMPSLEDLEHKAIMLRGGA